MRGLHYLTALTTVVAVSGCVEAPRIDPRCLQQWDNAGKLDDGLLEPLVYGDCLVSYMPAAVSASPPRRPHGGGGGGGGGPDTPHPPAPPPPAPPPPPPGTTPPVTATQGAAVLATPTSASASAVLVQSDGRIQQVTSFADFKGAGATAMEQGNVISAGNGAPPTGLFAPTAPTPPAAP